MCCGVALLLVAGACGSGAGDTQPSQSIVAPSPDPADYAVDTSVEYTIHLSEPQWLIPSEQLPDGVSPMAANNNVDIV